MKQGILNANLTKTLQSVTLADNLEKSWKSNLTCLTIWRAKVFKLDVEVKTCNEILVKSVMPIRDLFEGKYCEKRCKDLANWGIFYLDQLLNREGSQIITWWQFKILRKLLAKSWKATWFKELELEVLEDITNRRVKEGYKASNSNKLATRIKLKEVLSDKRKRE